MTSPEVEPRLMKTFAVKVDGYSPIIFTAATASKARFRAFLQYTDVYPCSFRLFLAKSSVRPVPPPAGVDAAQLERGWAQH